MKIDRLASTASHRSAGPPAFTLIEVAVAAAIAAILLAGMFQGYNIASRRAQYSACSLAANTMAVRQMELCIAPPWYPTTGVTNLLAQRGTYTTNLCLPTSQSNGVTCTITYSVTPTSANPPYAMIDVKCAWTLPDYGGTFTNEVAVLRAPNE
jgi:prepilin-type N-terminal cleavage/methylation domain-containing protein